MANHVAEWPETAPAASQPAHAPANQAVWLTAKRGRLVLGPAPYTTPRDTEIVIRNGAIAINPVDWMVLPMGDFIYPWLTYPAIIGTDVAGEVTAVGRAVTRFKVGDRVLGHAVGCEKTRKRPAEGAFQAYTVLQQHMACPIPDAMTFENAAVLPLGLSTAACGLFQKDYLALDYPSANAKPTGKTLLVWGGSTSVGSNAIQLAVAAGYEVIATASPKNFDYLKSLGASMVFDYASKTVVPDIIKAFDGRTGAGAIAIGAGSASKCLDIIGACTGDKFIATASTPVSLQKAPAGAGRALWLIPTMARMIAVTASNTLKARTRQIRTKFIWGGALMHNEVSRVIYTDFLPQALADGRYRAAPAPLLTGSGLGNIPAAMDIQKQGVSARKVVVTL